jgi:hypothetical protein
MAKKQDKNLLQTLRGTGLRKKAARALTDAAGRTNRGKQPTLVTRTIQNLRTAASALESRVTSANRSEAAKKAARTRKRNAAQRKPAPARKAAKTRSKRA